jgi:hypothetical protein
MLQKH